MLKKSLLISTVIYNSESVLKIPYMALLKNRERIDKIEKKQSGGRNESKQTSGDGKSGYASARESN